MGEVSRPVDIELGTIRSNPILLRASPISFPKGVAPFRIGDIDDFHHRNPLYVKRLSETKTLCNR